MGFTDLGAVLLTDGVGVGFPKRLLVRVVQGLTGLNGFGVQEFRVCVFRVRRRVRFDTV